MVLSGQIDRVVVERYERNKWLVLRGNTNDDTLISTYRFMREIVGYDLAAFFQRNAAQLKQVIVQTLETLLDANSDE